MACNWSAFAAPHFLRPSLLPVSTSTGSICRFPASSLRHGMRVSRMPRVCMSADGSPPPSEERPSPMQEATPTEKDVEEPKYSFWGIASFGILFVIFMLSIVATLSRDFIPGGMTGPA